MKYGHLVAACAICSAAAASSAQTVQPLEKHLACLAWKYGANDEAVEGSRQFLGVHFRDAGSPAEPAVEVVSLEDPSQTFVGARKYLARPAKDSKGFNIFWTDDAGIKNMLAFTRVGKKVTQFTEDWDTSSAKLNQKDQVIKKGLYAGNCVLVWKIEGFKIIRDGWLKEAVK